MGRTVYAVAFVRSGMVSSQHIALTIGIETSLARRRFRSAFRLGLRNLQQDHLTRAIESERERVGYAAAYQHDGTVVLEAQTVPTIEPSGRILLFAAVDQNALSTVQVPGENESISRGDGRWKDARIMRTENARMFRKRSNGTVDTMRCFDALIGEPLPACREDNIACRGDPGAFIVIPRDGSDPCDFAQ